MGYQKCITEIQNAASGRLTDNDLEALLNEIIQRARRNDSRQADGEKFKAAAAEMAKDVETALAIEKRNKIINLEKRVARHEHYRAVVAQTGDIAMAIESRINGINTPVDSGRRSVEAITNGLRRQWLGAMLLDLDEAGLTKAFQADAFVKEWAAELAELNKGARGTPGVTGSKEGRAIADILYKYQRASVESMNREGAWVRDYFGYVSRTSHSPDKVRQAGREQWIKDVMDGLDIERTFGGDAREALNALGDLWIDFKDGNHLRFEDGLEGIAFPGMNMAKKASASRVLHWKTSDDWVNYVGKYGTGPARQIMLEGFDRAARATGLMQVYGTNPRAAFDADLEWARTEFRGADDKVRALGNRESALINRFSILDGTANRPADRLWAAATAWALGSQRWAKLGGASITAITDVAFKAAELRYQGVDFLERWDGMLTGYLRGRGSEERKEIADLLMSGLEARMGQMHLRYDVMDATPGTISRIDHVFFKLTGLTQMTVNQRSDFEVMLAAHLGKQKGQSWQQLRRETVRAMRMAGVTPEHWELLRGVDWNTAGGRTYLTPDVARRLDDAAVEKHLRDKGRLGKDLGPEAIKAKVDAFKDNLVTTLAAFYADRGTYAVLESGVRERAMLLRGTRPGTPEGIALRLMAQFKAFPTAVITRVWGREIYGGQGRMGAASGLVQMMVSSMMLGYVAMTLKDMIKGREPRIPEQDDVAGTAQILGAAFMQGGGLGLYGDFLFGNFNRHNRDLLATVAGPVLSNINELAKVLSAYREGDDATAKAVKLAMENAPGGNVWWLKTALDHLVMYQIQEAMNPGSVLRMERAVERNNNTTFWLRPSESVR